MFRVSSCSVSVSWLLELWPPVSNSLFLLCLVRTISERLGYSWAAVSYAGRVIIVVRGTDVLRWSTATCFPPWARYFLQLPLRERVFSWAVYFFLGDSLAWKNRSFLSRAVAQFAFWRKTFHENTRKPRVPFSLRATWLLARSCYVRTPAGLQYKIIVSPSCCSLIST